MKKNQPQDQPPNLQMTPVEFAPPQSADAIGTITRAPIRTEFRFSVFVPLLIILATLNFTTVRDIKALNRRMVIINAENVPALDILKRASKEGEFYDSLHSGVHRLAQTDPVAAQIEKDFFPAPPVRKESSPDTQGKAPAK